MNNENTPTVASVDRFVIVPRPKAQTIVDAVTISVEQYKAVDFGVCIRLLGPERFLMLRADPIRRLGPKVETVYPWNVVDYLSCENPRQRSR
jgi:hypothetical protein